MILGFLYGQMGLQDKAVPLIQRALKISEKTLGPENPQITAAALNNLVVLYTQRAPMTKPCPWPSEPSRLEKRCWAGPNRRTAESLQKLWGFSTCQERLWPGGVLFPPGQTVNRGTRAWWNSIWPPGQYESALNTLTPHRSPGLDRTSIPGPVLYPKRAGPQGAGAPAGGVCRLPGGHPHHRRATGPDPGRTHLLLRSPEF